MKALIITVLLGVSTCHSKEQTSKSKRGVFGENVLLGHGLSTSDFGHGIIDLGLSNGFNFDHGNLDHAGLSLDHTLDLGAIINKHITVTKNIGVPIPHLVPYPVVRKIAVPVPHAVLVPVDKPYPVHVSKPYPVPVDKPVPVPVDRPVPYPVGVPVKVPVSVPVAVPVPRPYPVAVTNHVPVLVKKPAPAFSLGSGSLGYAHLGNGVYALGSGSLGYSGHVAQGLDSGSHGLDDGFSSKFW